MNNKKFKIASSLLSMPKDRANRNLKNFIVRLIGDKLEVIF